MEMHTEPMFAKDCDFTEGKPLALWVEEFRAAAWERLQTVWLVDPFDNDRRWIVVHGYHSEVPRVGGRNRKSSFVCVGNDSHDPKAHRNIYEPHLSHTYGLQRLWVRKQENRDDMWSEGKRHLAAIQDLMRGAKTL